MIAGLRLGVGLRVTELELELTRTPGPWHESDTDSPAGRGGPAAALSRGRRARPENPTESESDGVSGPHWQVTGMTAAGSQPASPSGRPGRPQAAAAETRTQGPSDFSGWRQSRVTVTRDSPDSPRPGPGHWHRQAWAAALAGL
jgi:hypothetical protein